jgi:hypothetical protein
LEGQQDSEEPRQTATDDVGADALLFAVVDRPQVNDLFEVALAALGFEELLVAQHDVLGGQSRSLVGAVEVGLGHDGCHVDAEQSAGGDA